jgi:hypothetical protein
MREIDLLMKNFREKFDFLEKFYTEKYLVSTFVDFAVSLLIFPFQKSLKVDNFTLNTVHSEGKL